MFNYLLTNQLPDDSLLSSANLDYLARKNLLIQRESAKFSAAGFVHSLLSSVIDGNSSLTDIGLNIGDYQQSNISKQGVHQRFTQKSVDFLSDVNASLLAQKFEQTFPLESSCFKRILVEDASLVHMHTGNNKDFKGFGNRKGKTAAFKIDFCYDFLSGKSISTERTKAYDNDKKAGSKFINNHVRKRDLVLRDMGYFKQSDFSEIESLGAFWLSKIPTNVSIKHEGKDFNEILKHTKLNSMDIEVELSGGAFKCRLVAVRASPVQAAEKRRRAKKQARNHGKTPRENAQLRNGWHITVTNITKAQMDTQKIVNLYRLRWQIETIFKAWKQSSNLKKCFNKQSNIFHQKCLIEASLLLLLLTMKFVVILQSQNTCWLSVRKVAKTLALYIIQVKKMDEIALFAPDPRYIKMESRSRSNLMELAKKCLT
jgi:IS4 transposase